MFQQLGDLIGEINGTVALGNLALKIGEVSSARSHFLHALELARPLKSKDILEQVIIGLGLTAYRMHDYVEMEKYFQQDQKLTAETAGEFHNLWPLRMQAKATLRQGNFSRAWYIFRQNLLDTQNLEDVYGVLSNLLGLAGVAAHTGDCKRALQLLSFFNNQMQTIFKPADPDDQTEYQWHLSVARERLDPKAFSQLWEYGRGMTLDQAIETALAIELANHEPTPVEK